MVTQSFKTTIQKSGTRTFIAIPFIPNEVWGVKQRHHIHGTVTGREVRGSLGSDGSQYFLPLGEAWRRDNGLQAGDVVVVELFPEGPQSDNVADDIAMVLNADPVVRAFFDGLPTFYRNNYIRWIETAKRPETRSARINEMLGLLKAGKREK
jgi:hypothetical protein